MKEGRTILFVDQSGFYLLPTVVRTYAPIGQTPVLHEQLSRDHLSVISGISLEGKLYMMEQERSFKSQDIVRFLRHLLRQIEGKLLVVWDGSPIHRGQAVKDFLASGASSRLQLEQLPGYAPDLNPDEGIWKHLKYVELKIPEARAPTIGNLLESSEGIVSAGRSSRTSQNSVKRKSNFRELPFHTLR